MSPMGWFVEGATEQSFESLGAGDAAQDELAQLLLAIPGDASHADDLPRVEHQVDLLAGYLRPSPAGTRPGELEHR